MKLATKLQAEVAFFRDVLLTNRKLVEIVKNDRQKPLIKELAKYMIYGLIAPNEIGVWNYTLGENVYKIINKAEVNKGEKPWQRNFMEMAVCGVFHTMEKYSAHRVLLEKKATAIDEKIYDGSMEAFNELKARHNTLKAKAESYVAAIEAARNDGEDISAENQEVEWFYNLFIKFLDEFIEVFSA